MNDISEKEYPQASKGGAAQAPGAVEGFDRHGAIHNRPGRIESWERTGEGLLLRTETRAKKSCLVYTHETSMHQFQGAEPTLDRLCVRLTLFRPDIFRVTVSVEEDQIGRASCRERV